MSDSNAPRFTEGLTVDKSPRLDDSAFLRGDAASWVAVYTPNAPADALLFARSARLAGLVRERRGLVDDFSPADDYRAWRRKTDRFIAIDRELRALIGELFNGEVESDG